MSLGVQADDQTELCDEKDQVIPEENHAGDSLNNWIERGDGSVAESAPAAELQPADHRKVVIPFEQVVALRAVRRRRDPRLMPRHPPHPYVQEPANALSQE